MLNCTLLLDSANRFGLRQGNYESACDAGKMAFPVSYLRVIYVLTPLEVLTSNPSNRYWNANS